MIKATPVEEGVYWVRVHVHHSEEHSIQALEQQLGASMWRQP